MMQFEHRASDAAETLPWDARIAVALEAATALEYVLPRSSHHVLAN
jgi:hypothetical protein